MDPNVCLEILLRMAKRVNDTHLDMMDKYEAQMLAEYVLALDEWIKGGGFMPSRWDPTVKEETT